MAPLRLGFLASHNGSNMQAILDACKEGRLAAQPAVVISNNSESGALARARQEGIPACHLSGHTHPGRGALDQAICAALTAHQVEVVCLAGYMKRLGPQTLAAYRGRVLNIHPALLPKFGGEGFYGQAVHQAVLAAGEKESGPTVHLVDEEYDHGPVLAQARVPVLPGDNPETLAARVLAQEHRLYADTLQRIARGEITLAGLTR
ncbi:MAG: phosphoribosylglycinamide formyltransferase [Candidatus Latescibacteria bacterium]|nr:phosphoribosylglycinamide formyltransferase [Candidatus Latescibacterota bacterium]